MRVAVYVDGFNLYYRALKGSAHKWLDPVKLARSLLGDDDDIVLLRYFTARISPRAGDPDAPRRQQIYLSALATLPEVKFHYGRFLSKTKVRPLVAEPERYVEVFDTEEKGSDVNLASYLLHDGFSDRYDVALVVSQDTDLCEPMRLTRDHLQKTVGLVWLDGKLPGKRLKSVSSFVRHATPSRLASAQLPESVLGRNGHLLRRPLEWTAG
ncbi:MULTISPECIES: NYN domain-containing protein [Hyphobacterium]|uniref:NYN domain-containing protein n=1 Tax=Hyphobacterium vulgare TaxID=1736751 RepID=A0ABV6ZXZ2_9PROT